MVIWVIFTTKRKNLKQTTQIKTKPTARYRTKDIQNIYNENENNNAIWNWLGLKDFIYAAFSISKLQQFGYEFNAWNSFSPLRSLS